MALKIACQMDPIDRIDISGDSTFALLLEAQARGHDIFYYTPDRLSLDGATLKATGASLQVRDAIGDHFTLSNHRAVDLSTRDVVLLRQDPPFDMSYITTTHLLERIHPKTLVVNDPVHVRNAPEKIWVLDFQDLMPPTMVARSLEDIKTFRAKHNDIIVKPMYGNESVMNSGIGILHHRSVQKATGIETVHRDSNVRNAYHRHFNKLRTTENMSNDH